MGDHINFINYAINFLPLSDVFAKCTRAQQQAIEATNRNWCIQVKTVTDSLYTVLEEEQEPRYVFSHEMADAIALCTS